MNRGQEKRDTGVENEQTGNPIIIKTFGTFSLMYNGRSLAGQKAMESQFAYLMQMVLHYRRDGISREAVEEVLFGDRDVDDPRHAFRTVLYNARKKLEKTLGKLPDGGDYIIQKDGMLYWTGDVPVEEDAALFESLWQQAEAERNRDERLRLLLEALHTYTGEFLGAYVGFLWVAAEERRYRILFCRCVEEIVELLRSRQDYIQMQKVGEYASRISPFSDWEAVTMEALIGMGRYEEADRLYADTAQIYFEERGLKPSQKLLDSLKQLGDQFEHPYEAVGLIQENLNENREKSGPYVCSYPVFQGIYQMLGRMSERSGQSVYLMLCTVVDSKGNPMKEGAQLEELSARLGEAIVHSIRRSDVVNRYGSGQYLILLLNITLESCRIVQKRIDRMFLSSRQRTGVAYHVSSILQDE